jgi:hypothetical protein
LLLAFFQSTWRNSMKTSFWKMGALALAMALTLSLTLYGKQGGGAPQGGGPPAMKNLKVFPKDTPPQRIMQTMNGWTRALGVKCDHCHVDDKASDEKPTKDVARAMLKMMGNLRQNAADFFPGDRIQKVSCWTCHRGSAKIEMPAPPAPPGGERRPPQE